MSDAEASNQLICGAAAGDSPPLSVKTLENEGFSFQNLEEGKRVAALQQLLGGNTVMIPVHWRTKKPAADGWQKTRIDKMHDSNWLDQLEQGNIGILLGEASGNLISIDCDSDEVLVEMANLNPWIKETLQSKGARGGNYWLRMQGEYPKNTVVLRDNRKQAVGEFRSGGSQTIIFGKHPKDVMYKIVRVARALEVPFEKIVWPDCWRLPWRKTMCERITAEEGEFLSRGSGGRIEFNTPAWARLLSAHDHVAWDQSTASFRVYNPTSGIWEKESEPQLGMRINRLIKDAADQTKVKDLVFKRRTGLTHEILSVLKGIEAKNFEYEGPACICVKTGVLVFESPVRGHLTTFSPHYKRVSALKVGFDRDAKCPKFLNEILGSVLAPEQIRVVQCYFGMVLIGQSNLYQKILILSGVAAAGKSILVEVLEGMLGTENCAELRTKHLDGRFEMASFVRKVLLTGKDVPADFFSEEGAQRLKALTGGDWMEAEFKGESAKVPIRGAFNVVINCNGRPQLAFQSDADAWGRRLLVVRYDRPMPCPPAPGAVRRLIEEEGAGILNWAIAGYRHVISAGSRDPFSGVSEASQEVIEASDSLKSFVSKSLVYHEKSTVTTDELMAAYTNMCKCRGWDPLSRAQFHRAIEKAVLDHWGVSKSHDITRQGKSRNGFRNLTLEVGSADHGA